MESIANLASASNKNDILDPLSVVIKLFIYSFKPVGTKISIGYNKLSIQENTYVQGVWRRLNGDTKNDVNILLCPILYACVHYLKNMEEEEEEVFLTIFKITLDGLVNMKQTYAGTPIVYNIEHIVNIINLFIDKGRKDSSDELSVDESICEVNSIINIDTPIYKIKETIYHHLNTSWTPHRKNILFGFVKDITEVHNTTLKASLVNALAQFMDCMDIVVASVLLNNRI